MYVFASLRMITTSYSSTHVVILEMRRKITSKLHVPLVCIKQDNLAVVWNVQGIITCPHVGFYCEVWDDCNIIVLLVQRVGKCEEVEGLSNKALYGQYRENTVFLAL